MFRDEVLPETGLAYTALIAPVPKYFPIVGLLFNLLEYLLLPRVRRVNEFKWFRNLEAAHIHKAWVSSLVDAAAVNDVVELRAAAFAPVDALRHVEFRPTEFALGFNVPLEVKSVCSWAPL